jgi:hypothetical protein
MKAIRYREGQGVYFVYMYYVCSQTDPVVNKQKIIFKIGGTLSTCSISFPEPAILGKEREALG